jgi:ABC-type uncharacterized transport system auxiliary subunit
VLRAAALEVLGASGKFRLVSPEGVGYAADETLHIELRDFQAEYGSADAPVVHVRLVATLARRASRELVASAVAEASASAAGNRLGLVVEAFRRATADALRQLAQALPPATSSAP